MFTVEQLHQQTSPNEWARGLGYLRNQRVHDLFVKTSGDGLEIDASVQAARSYRVHLDWFDRPDAVILASCDCQSGERGFCRHTAAAAVQFLLQIGDRTARKLIAGKKVDRIEKWIEGDFETRIQILLQLNRLADQIRVLPRMILQDSQGSEMMRIYPLAELVDESANQAFDTAMWPENANDADDADGAEDANDTNQLDAAWQIRSFFAPWAEFQPDGIGGLTLSLDAGLAYLFREIIPCMPPDWSVLYDEELEKIRPRRRLVSMDVKMHEVREPGLLSFSVSFQCNRLSITLDQLRMNLRDQQLWLIENSQYIEVCNREQMERFLQFIDEGPFFESDGTESTRFALRFDQAVEFADWLEGEKFTDPGCEIADESKGEDFGESSGTDRSATLANPMNRKERSVVGIDQRLHDFIEGLSLATRKKQSQPAQSNPVLSDRMEKVLRPYQKDGVAWLQFLRTYHLGGILADDMGLGKTLQILAFLTTNPRKRPSLIICPKSLAYNWLHEAKRFTPELSAILIQGNRANRLYLYRQAMDCDLVIITYSLFLGDADLYLGLEFETCILDEAQIIKNPDTHLARQIKKIRAGLRLALSGTPMENTKLDLWSIFDYVLPGLLGPRSVFMQQYADTLSDCQDPASQTNAGALVKRIYPFMLRRTKTDVLPELPPKIEETLYVDLTQNQLSLYTHILQQIRKDLQKIMSGTDIARSPMAILAGLTRLRQICNHPGLIYPQYRAASGLSCKMELFELLIDQCMTNGHKTLVFSQFTQMLSLIGERLASKKFEFAVLDGQTSDRQAEINRFNQDDRVRVFLISLKAGGFGLNLTTADTVILFDPWWNPMTEDQAADRAHRMGQNRPVTVYRLVTRNTIEEKMESLKLRKRRHFDAIVNEAGNRSASISLTDLQELLADPNDAPGSQTANRSSIPAL